jgi:hypothetical protein
MPLTATAWINLKTEAVLFYETSSTKIYGVITQYTWLFMNTIVQRQILRTIIHLVREYVRVLGKCVCSEEDAELVGKQKR